MKRITTNQGQRYRLVYSLGEHPYLGYLIEPHAVLLNPNGELSFTHNRIFSSTAGDYEGLILDDLDKQLIAWLDEIDQVQIIKRFYKKNIRPADYFAKVFDKQLYETIRPKIDQRLMQVLDSLRQAKDKLLYLMGKEGYPADQALKIADEPASVLFHFRRNESETRYFPTIKFAGQRIEFMYRDAQIIVNEQAWMLLDQVLYHFDEPLEGKKLTPFLNKRYIAVPRATEKKYFEVFVRALIERHHVYAEGFAIKTYQHDAVPILKISAKYPSQMRLEIVFRYGPYEFAPAQDNRVTVRMEYSAEEDQYTFHRIRRSVQWENKLITLLGNLGLRPKPGYIGEFEVDPDAEKEGGRFDAVDADQTAYASEAQIHWNWIQKHRSDLENLGVELQQGHGKINYFLGQTTLTLSVKEQSDWFDLHAVAHFGAFDIPFVKLKNYILSGKREFALPNGEIAIIPEEWFARYPQLFHFMSSEDAHLHVKKHHLGLLEDVGLLGSSELEESRISRKMSLLKHFEHLDDVPLPTGFRGVLRPYQQAGFNWFYFLKEHKFGGCLADDMGLGKTIQTLALLQKEKEDCLVPGMLAPSLIIMPTSLIYNWQREAEKFVPELNILVHTGGSRIKDSQLFYEYDLIITTYGIARIDQALLKEMYFHYIILDESQHIKNPSSKAFKVVKSLQGRYRLTLSGTPIENSVADLWSQMAFLNPGLLGSNAYFQDAFVAPIEKKKDDRVASRLQAIIKPFVLRRTKEQVATELPPKSEQVVYCEMEEDQREYYERIKSEYRNLMLDAQLQGRSVQGSDQGEASSNDKSEFTQHNTNGQSGGKAAAKGIQIALLQGLTKLRQVANHPAMIDEEYKGSSSKFHRVLEQLEGALQRGNKVLIFSQFVKQLALFRAHFDAAGVPYSYLDGATQNRAEEVDKFKTQDDVRLFLISIKAGGVGLNLTEADYVFVLDPWWNPAVEQQAVDRAHRIGQTKTVFIYKFITKDTLEEKILALQERKSRIAERLITVEESFYKSLSQEDIEMLLS